MDLHGHRVIYRIAGSGPPVVLIHGMVNSSRHWESVALRLADSYTVIAPDLIGHGDSATPRGDYSLGAHAASIRDLLAAIEMELDGFLDSVCGRVEKRRARIGVMHRRRLLIDLRERKCIVARGGAVVACRTLRACALQVGIRE